MLIEKSPRTVPGRGGDAVGRAEHGADDRDRLVPLEHADDHRAAGDEVDQAVEERLALVLGVVLLAQGAVDLDELQGGDPQALGLEPLEDLADQPALDAIGLEDDQGALHGESALASEGRRRPKSLPGSASGNESGSLAGPSRPVQRQAGGRSSATIRQGSSSYESGSSRQTRTSGVGRRAARR